MSKKQREVSPGLMEIAKELLKGKSLVRSTTDLRCRSIGLSGTGLDLGAKRGDSSYFDYFDIAANTKTSGIDIIPGGDLIIQADLEKALPIPANSQDFILAMNIFEHIYEYRFCIGECYRVLNDGGRLIGVVPFLKNIHPDPDDVFRFTGSGLERIFSEAGFQTVDVQTLGFGPVTASVSQSAHLLKLRLFTTTVWTMEIVADRIVRFLARNSRGTSPDAYPLGYYFVAWKVG